MNTAFIFPGQGSQIVGMGKILYDNFLSSKEVFNEVDDALGIKLSKIIFEGPIDVLTLTENTQPAIMATSIAIVRAIEKELNKKIYTLCKFMAGHSLGEYTALCASGAISLSDTAKILQIRGKAMQEACTGLEVGMAACLDTPIIKLKEILDYCKKEGVVEIANDNTDSQVIISGEINAIDRVIAILKDMGKKAIKLNVSAPFHSSLIIKASDVMRIELKKIQITLPNTPIIQNISVSPEIDPNIIKDNLVKQVASPVRWRETLEFLHKNNIDNLIETGPGKVLTGMLKRTNYNFSLLNLSSLEEVNKFIELQS
jgi:[acyl-carrier-protein] S-malonyltransferase